MNSNIYFLFVWLETILFSSTEITDFSSQLSFYLANIKSKIWQLYVIWRHHCQSTRGSYLPLLIFSYKGISILYYSMLGTIFYSSTEITDFSWQLYSFLVNFKSEIWQIYVIRRHHCQSTRGSYLPLLIFSYKGISALYSMVITLFFAYCKKGKIFKSRNPNRHSKILI